MRKHILHLTAKKVLISFGVLVLLFFLFLVCVKNKKKQQAKTMLTIAVLQDTRVSNLDSNYYKNWLEEQTGYQIQFEYISEGYEREYLKAMLTSSHNTVDAVFLPERQEILPEEEFEAFVSDGLILDLKQYKKEGCNLSSIVEKYGSERTETYFFPNIDTSRKAQNLQVLWLNMGWLKKLNLEIPRTNAELMTVLQAFLTQDPNQNGIQDELPLISCEADISLRSYYYLLNSFTYYNPGTIGISLDDSGNLIYTPMNECFREGLSFCNSLYQTGTLSQECFSFSKKQLMELVNAPDDFVGAFTSQSISDVVYSNCSDVLARYIQVAPLCGEKCEGNAVRVDYQWNIGGYIPSNSKHPKEAFNLMDQMLSEEASLIAEFGEEGIDWKFSEDGDLSTYGTKALITTLRYIEDSVQNKNFAGMGPHVLLAEYANGVTWNGNNSLVEYIDARAVKSYEPYFIDNSNNSYSGNSVLVTNKDRVEINEMIRRFITGEQSVSDDQVWEIFCENYMDRIRKAGY